MSELNNIPKEGTWGAASDILNDNFAKVAVDLEKVKNATTKNKGYFATEDGLKTTFPFANEGSIAYVGSSYPFALYRYTNGVWVDTGAVGGDEKVNLSEYLRIDEIQEYVSIDAVEGKRGDLEIADEHGYVIARFIDGHIVTKSFDSRNLPNIGVVFE